jgi:dihydroorotate dehydrogenase
MAPFLRCFRLSAGVHETGSTPDLHRLAVELVRDLYSDFGPTLAREKLIELHGIRVAKETLRKWMAAAKMALLTSSWKQIRRLEDRVQDEA